MATNPRIRPVERATHRSWDEWLRFMEGIGAQDLDHKAIALKVYEELDGRIEQHGWWAQSVTVAYEQHIGRRLPGQRSDGTFQLSVSRSTSLGLDELMQRWEKFAADDDVVRDLVVAGDPRVSGSDKRITWRTRARDGSSVIVTSELRSNGSASLVVNQMGLASAELNDEARERWVSIVQRFLEAAAA